MITSELLRCEASPQLCGCTMQRLAISDQLGRFLRHVSEVSGQVLEMFAEFGRAGMHLPIDHYNLETLPFPANQKQVNQVLHVCRTLA
jgi:hypothetical protein